MPACIPWRQKLKSKAEKHLREKLIPFWSGLCDREYGGFYGYVDQDLNIHPDAEKGCILMSRITWFFANTYMILGDAELLGLAKHGYEFLTRHCFDRQYGGIYWSVQRDGTPSDTAKHTYNHAFAIYALASYYDASKDREALKKALSLFSLIEEKMRDEGGYLESFNRQFIPASNEKLSENGVEAVRTMNTHLHVMEAYTELLRVLSENDSTSGTAFPETDRAGVFTALAGVCRIFLDKIWNPEKKRAEVFFNHDWHSLIDLWSSGHDIESSWLCGRTAVILENAAKTEEEKAQAAGLKKQFSTVTAVMAEQVLRKAIQRDSVVSEFENGNPAPGRTWWVQAEAVTGFTHAFLKNPRNREYREAACKIWDFIMNHFADPREGGEWFGDLDENLQPAGRPIVEPWKCPYHNGRMCLELIRSGGISCPPR